MKELLLGCGSRTVKDLYVNGNKDFNNVVRLDNNCDHKPDIVLDLSVHPLPFADNEFDEIHAYEVLEHLAQQGDYEFFFREFTEYWRILKPGGFFMASCPAPTSVWAFGDPSHKRCISKECLVFLSQDQYRAQIGKTSMSDFRYLYKADFKTIYAEVKGDTTYFILRKM
jgi:SAM-dependent methyltransferase